MTEIVLVRRRDAKTDPPQPFSDLVWTDQGPARYRWYRHAAWQDHEGCELDPSWWLDIPQDVEGKSLTINDIRCVLSDAMHGATSEAPEIDLLRAALDALDTRNGDNGGQSN